MDVIKTARQKLRNHTRYFDFTLGIYREACEFIGIAVRESWSDIEAVRGAKPRAGYIEKLIHSTAKNSAPYPEFDKRFYKFPAYLRRAAISEALGYVTQSHDQTHEVEDRPERKTTHIPA